MAKGSGGGGGQSEGNALKTAVVVVGGLFLAWLTVETAFKPFLDGIRASLSRSTDPTRDPDEEDAAASAAEPSAPPLLAEEEGGEKKKGEEKDVEMEKGEGPVPAKAE